MSWHNLGTICYNPSLSICALEGTAAGLVTLIWWKPHVWASLAVFSIHSAPAPLQNHMSFPRLYFNKRAWITMWLIRGSHFKKDNWHSVSSENVKTSIKRWKITFLTVLYFCNGCFCSWNRDMLHLLSWLLILWWNRILWKWREDKSKKKHFFCDIMSLFRKILICLCKISQIQLCGVGVSPKSTKMCL